MLGLNGKMQDSALLLGHVAIATGVVGVNVSRLVAHSKTILCSKEK